MLSSISLTWFDVFIIFAMMAAPYVLGVVILILVIKSAIGHSGSRKFLLWLVLPQFLITLMVWWGLNFYNVYTSFGTSFTASIAMLGE